MFLAPLTQQQPVNNIRVPYNWVGKILKVPVFRLALGNDLISRMIIAVHNFFSRICQPKSRSFRDFDTAKAQKSLDRFVALGATAHFVTPRDAKGEIQMMTFKSEDLEKKIQALGGSWGRQNFQGKQVFAITPPEQAGQAWMEFKEKLSHFHWREEEGMLITCDCADEIPSKSEKRCFLYTHSTSTSFIRDWKRAGFYIGAKQDLCFFDNGNTWKNSGRTISEESFYLEIEAVYDKIKSEYPVNRLWVGGSCGGAPVAAYLKRLLHNQGVNFFAEQSFSDLDDFVKPISPFFAPYIKGSLSDPTLPQTIQNCPPACQFGTAKLWENLSKQNKGKIILVQVKEDEHIKPDAYNRYLNLANKVNKNVKHLLYSSSSDRHHTDIFLRYQKQRQEFFKAVFS